MRDRRFNGGGNLFNLSAYDMHGEKNVYVPNTLGPSILTGGYCEESLCVTLNTNIANSFQIFQVDVHEYHIIYR
jgi:hypothetical protein